MMTGTFLKLLLLWDVRSEDLKLRI